MTEKPTGPEGEIISPRFNGNRIELPRPQEYSSQGVVVGQSIEYTRSQLLRFLDEADPDDPLKGKIMDGLHGTERVEKPLSEALVYLVDDDKLVLTSMQRLVRKYFKNIKTFMDGREVLEAVRTNGDLVEVPHLIVTDINMKYVHGNQLARKIQDDLDPAIRPRFVAVTGRREGKNIQDFVEFGMPVLEKPMNSGTLLALMTQELRQHPTFKREVQA